MYVTRFNKEVLQEDESEDHVLLSTFQAGLRSEDFLFLITKNPPTTMADLLLKAQKYMNAEDVLTAKEITKRPRKKKEIEDHPDRRKRANSHTACQRITKGVSQNSPYW